MVRIHDAVELLKQNMLENDGFQYSDKGDVLSALTEANGGVDEVTREFVRDVGSIMAETGYIRDGTASRLVDKYGTYGLTFDEVTGWNRLWLSSKSGKINGPLDEMYYSSDDRVGLIRTAVKMSNGDYNADLPAQLVDALSGGDWDVRYAAAEGLLSVYDDSGDYYGQEAFVQAFANGTPDQRLTMSTAIRENNYYLNGQTKMDLNGFLKDDLPVDVRVNIAGALAHSGVRTSEVLISLSQIIDGSAFAGYEGAYQNHMQKRALEAIEKFGGVAASNCPALAEIVRGNSELRDEAIDTLAHIGAPAVATLQELALDRETEVRLAALDGFSSMVTLNHYEPDFMLPMGAEIRQFVSENALQDSKWPVRIAGAEVALSVDQAWGVVPGEDAMAVYSSVLGGSQDEVGPKTQMKAAKSMAGAYQLGAGSETLVQTLALGLKDGDADVRQETIKSLGSCYDSPQAVKSLCRVLTTSSDVAEVRLALVSISKLVDSASTRDIKVAIARGVAAMTSAIRSGTLPCLQDLPDEQRTEQADLLASLAESALYGRAG